jgi:hypothetical protein
MARPGLPDQPFPGRYRTLILGARDSDKEHSMSDDDGSVLGDLSDAVSHGLQGTADLLSSEVYTFQAGSEAAVGAAAHLAGGAAEAVGLEDAGESARHFGDHWQDEASASIHQAGRELSHAGDEFLGGSELPSMPDIPPVQLGPGPDYTDNAEYGTEYPDGSAEG